MSSRHTRRKAAKAKALDKAVAIATAAKAWERANIVRANLSKPVDRNYHSSYCPTGRIEENIYTSFREPKGGGAMQERSVQGLKGRVNAVFSKADGLTADSAALAGQGLSGKAIREREAKALQARVDAARAKRLS